MGYKGLSGQSAIEYLMTYGWMLLVVAIVGGAIFATVGDQNIESSSGFNGDVIVDNFGVSSEDDLGLEIRDGTGQGITVSKANISDPDTGQWIYKEFTGENRVGIGSSKIFELPNITRSNSGNQLNVEITYNTGGLSNLSEQGIITGQLQLNNTGSFEGLPEDGHEPISGENGGSLTLLDTVNYTYDDSGDVQVNESTAGDDGYQVDLNNDFSEEVEEIKILEMHGADGGDGEANTGTFDGASGGLLESYELDAGGISSLHIWTGEEGGDENSGKGGWGRSDGGSGGEVYLGEYSGGGGGSTEIWSSSNELIAAVDAGGGGRGSAVNNYDGGGGARGGQGYNNAEGSGLGGDGESSTQPPEDGEQEINNSFQVSGGSQTTGGSTEGHGWILIEYYG